VDDVLVTTRLDGMVARLPEGLDTTVGHRGIKLSGGERQRIAIARALLRRPRLLCSTRSPRNWTRSTRPRCGRPSPTPRHTTTVLVVAHRLSTVTMADRIVVMDAGQVRAVGSHTELSPADPLTPSSPPPNSSPPRPRLGRRAHLLARLVNFCHTS